MKKGDVVRVKPGVKDVNFAVDLSGWQGRVLEILDDGNVDVAWDSQTLLHDMPASMISTGEEQGYGWETYVFEPSKLEPAQARDKPADVKRAVAQLERAHAWDWLGEEGELVRQVLSGLNPENEVALIAAWNAYIEAHLAFPFDAVVDESQDRGPLHAGNRVRVHSIVDADEFYGIIVHLQRGRETFDFPLCDLAALDETSEDHAIIQSYRVWFANR